METNPLAYINYFLSKIEVFLVLLHNINRLNVVNAICVNFNETNINNLIDATIYTQVQKDWLKNKMILLFKRIVSLKGSLNLSLNSKVEESTILSNQSIDTEMTEILELKSEIRKYLKDVHFQNNPRVQSYSKIKLLIAVLSIFIALGCISTGSYHFYFKNKLKKV
jgi:hypothetical protein